jgi:hypothetical protein
MLGQGVLDANPEMPLMTDDDLQRVRSARERALVNAREFFGGLPAEQLQAMRARAEECGEGRCPTIDREAMATAYENNAWMPRADYLEMQRIVAAFQAGTPTADGEFATMLRLLDESGESIVRARVLAFLGELVKREAPGPDRIARIEEAIAPWREGPEDLDILYWAFVRQALDACPRRYSPPGR